MAKNDTPKKDDLGLNAEDAGAVKGGAHKKSHAEAHMKVARKIKKSAHTGPQKT